MTYLLHLLAGHPHLIYWFRDHRGDGHSVHHFVHVARHHPHIIHHLLRQRHYCHWLLNFLRTRDGLPGIDLLLGS